MNNQYSELDPDDLAELAKLPPGLLAEMASFAAKRGWKLAQFLRLALDDEVGVNLTRVNDPSPLDFQGEIYGLDLGESDDEDENDDE
jgi:hypothetical protein